MNRTGDVTYKDKVVGLLIEMPYGGTRFSYSENWIEESIACAFPINQRQFEWGNGLHPFFQNLLPEGWLRDGQAKAKGIKDDKDDFGLLLRFGKDCIGAVGVIDLSEEPTKVQQTDEISASINAHKTISGVQKNYLSTRKIVNFMPQ